MNNDDRLRQIQHGALDHEANSTQQPQPTSQTMQGSSFDYVVKKHLNDIVVPPTAPYPPMVAAPFKSSLSASPHYSTTYGRASDTAATTIAPESGLLIDAKNPVGGFQQNPNRNSSLGYAEEHFSKQGAPGSKLGGNSGGTKKSSAVGGTGMSGNSSTSSHPSRITFCPGNHDVVAAINCRSSRPQTDEKPTIGHRQSLYRNGNSGSTSSLPGKSSTSTTNGPIMLELKRLMVTAKDQDTCHDESKSESLFETRTIAVSRGNPNLGTTSVASTCMDIPSQEIVQNYDSGKHSMIAFTGSTTGAVCIHKFSTSSNEENLDYEFSASPIEYFHMPRNQRKASAIAWRPGIDTNHVAIGLVGPNATGAGAMNTLHSNQHRRSGTISMRSGGNSDREHCCFLWDIQKGKKTTQLAHNSPVASLAWMMDGQTLAVGGQQRTIQLYDLRLSTTNKSKLPPLSAHAHESGVHGIEVHPSRSHIMATFCRAVGEPVKLFDMRRMDSVLSEIKVDNYTTSNSATASNSTTSMSKASSIASQRMMTAHQAKVDAIQWSILQPGMLSIASGETIQEYDTSSGSRPSLVKINRTSTRGKAIQSIALYRGGNAAENQGRSLVSRLYPQRVLAVLEDQTIEDMARNTVAPLAISHRDGRLVHSLGPHLFMGTTSQGPTAMERILKRTECDADVEDISATMIRRARCLQSNPYSMDPEANIKLMSREILSEENLQNPSASKTEASPKYSHRTLLRLWGWIERVESLSFQEVDETEEDSRTSSSNMEISNAGVLQLLSSKNLKGNSEKEIGMEDHVIYSETLSCRVYDNVARRAALTSCGWAGKFDLSIVMAECEALGEYERSAALAVWHEDVGAAVEALQRASEAVRISAREGGTAQVLQVESNYSETLGLISMCIAGFGGKTDTQRSVWRRACASLLQREDMSLIRAKHSTRIAYLRGLCEFLMNAGTVESLLKVLENTNLSLCDRVAFACRFLDKKELTTYLLRCVEICQQQGDLEGLAVTGLSKPGIKILQSFVDRYSDVQTAALVVSRVILPADWASERKICFEWVESYRSMLNYWQMWQSRAMFDVDRADVLRRFKARNGVGNYQRRIGNSRIRQTPRPPDPDIFPRIPAQLEARCNYCSSPLSLKRQEGTTNQWLSKMQPLLNCCPQCRKPLPRCSICLLSMNTLNPYMELTRSRQGSRGGGKNMPTSDNLSSLSSMNFAEWYTWCMRCRHGGHAHHVIGWFSTHKVCPVSGCDCECQFDGAINLDRAAICIETEDKMQ